MVIKENKVNKISVNTLKEIIKAEKPAATTIVYMFGNQQVDIVIKNSIDKDDKIRFVRDITNGCFIDDEYTPHYREELFKIAVLEYFTNIKTDTVDTILFDLINNTNIYSRVIDKIPTDAIGSLTILVDDVIEWQKQEILSVQKQRLYAAAEDMEKTLEQMGELIKALNTMTKSFEGIDPKEVLEIYEKLANKDEDKLAKSVINFNLGRSENAQI